MLLGVLRYIFIFYDQFTYIVASDKQCTMQCEVLIEDELCYSDLRIVVTMHTNLSLTKNVNSQK